VSGLCQDPLESPLEGREESTADRHRFAHLSVRRRHRYCIGPIAAGTEGQGEQLVATCSPAKLLGEQLVHPAPQFFFCNLRLKVTLQTLRLLFSTKILENSPSFWGFATDPIVHCVYLFRKNTCCTKVYFEFDCLDCFLPIFAPPTEIIVPAPNWSFTVDPLSACRYRTDRLSMSTTV